MKDKEDGISYQTEHHVHNKDQSLSTDHSFPEVPWTTHLSHKLDEEHSTTIRVNDLHDTDDLIRELDVDDGGVDDRNDAISVRNETTGNSSNQVGSRVGDDTGDTTASMRHLPEG